MSEPWVGPRYDATRLLILGESAYSWWDDETGDVVHPPDQHCSDLVRRVLEDFDDCMRNLRFMVLLSRGLTGEHHPSEETLRFAWERVAFTNYITTTVGVGARLRPSDAQWNDAKSAFPELLDRLLPLRVVVLGKSMWGKMPGADFYFTDDVQGYRLADGSRATCWAVNHPAGGLSWKQLAAVVQFAYPNALRFSG